MFSALKIGMTGLEFDSGSHLVTSSSDVQELNWLLSLLPAHELARIPPLLMDQVVKFTLMIRIHLMNSVIQNPDRKIYFFLLQWY